MDSKQLYPLGMVRWFCAATLSLAAANITIANAAVTPLRTEQQTAYPAVYDDGGQAMHVYGYAFTPLQDGQLTRLGGRFAGTKTVILIDLSDGSIISSASVSGSMDNWRYVSPASGPIALVQGQS